MKALVLFDSNFGNTKIVAEAIGKELGDGSAIVSVSDFNPRQLEGTSLLVAGSPINAWRPSERMANFLDGLRQGQLNGIKAAAFDTRIKLFIHGDAASKISKKLESAGAEIISAPQAFIVRGKEGPLLEGETEKAREWAKSLKSRLNA